MTDPDKFYGMIIGLAIGDALGALHEFQYSSGLDYTGVIKHPTFLYNRFNSKLNRKSAIGQCTDDTEMTLCLLSSLVQTGFKYDQNDVLHRYIEWANSGTRMIGRNTRELFKGIKTINGYTSRYAKKYTTNSDRTSWSQSNGSLMRCSPIALIYDGEERERTLVADCALTNPHPQNININRIYISALRAALLGCSAAEIIEVARSAVEAVDSSGFRISPLSHLAEIVVRSGIEGEDGIDISGYDKGWCVYGLYCSLFVTRKNWPFHTSIDAIVRKGGDTDTNAAITGALVGARLGLKAMLAEPVTKKNTLTVYMCDTETGQMSRPTKYLIRSIIEPSVLDL